MTKHRMTDEEVSLLPLSAARAELMEEIMRADTKRSPETPVLVRPPNRAWFPALGAAAAVALLAGAAFVLPGLGGGEPGGTTAPATRPTSTDPGTEPSIAPAPAGSREWVALPVEGWTVTYVYGGDGFGEVQWENGARSLEVTLYPAASRAGYVEDRSLIDYPRRDPGTAVTLLGADARLWPYSATDHTTIGAVADGHFPEARGSGMGRATYLALLDQLIWVDTETFQSLLPADRFATDATRTSVIDQMLSGVPLPPDMGPISSNQMSRYQLGAEVAGAVACAWLDRFADAAETGDRAAAREARQALATAPEWPVLKEMDEEGDYPEVLWEYAAQVQRGEVPEGHAGGLGCS